MHISRVIFLSLISFITSSDFIEVTPCPILFAPKEIAVLIFSGPILSPACIVKGIFNLFASSNKSLKLSIGVTPSAPAKSTATTPFPKNFFAILMVFILSSWFKEAFPKTIAHNIRETLMLGLLSIPFFIPFKTASTIFSSSKPFFL